MVSRVEPQTRPAHEGGAGRQECCPLPCCCFPRCHLQGGEGASGQCPVTPCLPQHSPAHLRALCMPNSPLMAQSRQPRLGSPTRTARPPHRRPCQRAVVWMTWTSWGRPSCSSHCPRSPNKCGGEGSARADMGWQLRPPPPPPPPSPTGSSFWALPGPTGRGPGPACSCERRLLEDRRGPSSVLGWREAAGSEAGAGPVPWSTEVMREGRAMPYRAGVAGGGSRAPCAKVRKPRPERQGGL